MALVHERFKRSFIGPSDMRLRICLSMAWRGQIASRIEVLHETHLAFLLPLLHTSDHKYLWISLTLSDIRLVNGLFQHHPLHLLHGQLMIL